MVIPGMGIVMIKSTQVYETNELGKVKRKVITMHKLKTLMVMVTLSFAFAGCFESGSEQTPPPPVSPPPVGKISDGSTYYQSNCSTCHKAGADDTTSAFGAIDLAQRQDMITTNMSSFDKTSGFNLMGAFSNVPEQRVADLKAYLASVPII